MNLKSEYAALLAAATAPLGGVSAAEWREVLPGAGHVGAAVNAFARDLAAASGYESGRAAGGLLEGHCYSPTGTHAIHAAHTGVFGTTVSPFDLLSEGASAPELLPARLATRLVERNFTQWRAALMTFHSLHLSSLPGMPDAATWATAQQPAELCLPVRVPARLRATLDAALDEAVGAVFADIIRMTKEQLRITTIAGDCTAAQVARCCDYGYLLRHLRKVIFRGMETMRLHSRQVGVKASRYVSTQGFRFWLKRQQQQARWLERTYVRDRRGKLKDRPLAEVVMTNAAKRARMLAVMAGIEKLAVEDGLSAAMLTATLPPAWHPNPAFGTSSWGGTGYTPDQAVRAHTADWAAFLRDLDNAGVRISGMRVVEPHSDGCPHLHVMIYYRAEDEFTILARLAAAYGVSKIKTRALVVSASGRKTTKKGVRYDEHVKHFDAASAREEPGDGGARRLEWSRINRSVSAASSYVMKYVTKSINFDELSDKPTSATAAAAHASLWSYRRFSLFGIRKSLTVWDALRRVRKLPPDADPVAEALWMHANNGDFASYLRMMGGLSPSGGLVSRPVYSERITRYGDEVKEVIGVELYDGTTCLLHVEHREPGRFKLVSVDDSEEVEFELTE